jgi:Chain length determinant protein
MSDFNAAHQSSDDERMAFYWRMLRRWWLTIVMCTFIAPVITAVVSAMLITRAYRAQADIKPVPNQNNLNEMNVLQHLSGGLGQNTAEQAKEYIAIMQSFAFAKWVMRHDPIVASMLFSGAETARLKTRPQADSDWMAYGKISRALTCYYDSTAGLLRLRYVANDRDTAQGMLTILLDDLIADVRDRDIAGYSAQIKSLEAQADRTSDQFLREDLYGIIAKRIEQLSTADASALVAFRIIETPYVPPKAYKPQPLLYAAATAAAMPLVLFALIVFVERARAFIRDQSEAQSVIPNGLDHSDSALKVSGGLNRGYQG